jgi:hypothetical protein
VATRRPTEADIDWDVWDAASGGHVIKCDRDEVLDVVLSRCFQSRWKRQDNGRWLVVGRACLATSGRYLAVVVVETADGVLHPLTCYALGRKAANTYRGWLASKKS